MTRANIPTGVPGRDFNIHVSERHDSGHPQFPLVPTFRMCSILISGFGYHFLLVRHHPDPGSRIADVMGEGLNGSVQA